MARSKKKIGNPFKHVSLFDWRVAMFIGFLIGMVIATAKSYIGAIMLVAMVLGTLKLVEKGRI